MTNMTYVQAIDFALDVMNPDVDPDDDKFTWEEVREKLEALKAQLAKRSTSKTPTKTQKENEVVKETILAVLDDFAGKMTVTEMLTDDRLHGFSNQKISALLRQLVSTEQVVKTIEGKKSYFSVAVE